MNLNNLGGGGKGKFHQLKIELQSIEGGMTDATNYKLKEFPQRFKKQKESAETRIKSVPNQVSSINFQDIQPLIQFGLKYVLEKTLDSMGIGTVSLDDPRIVSFIRESTQTLGTITKQEFMDFLDRVEGLRKLRDFVNVDK